METGCASERTGIRRSLVLFLTAVLTIAAQTAAFAGMPAPGEQAPAFTLPGLYDAKVVSLKDLRGSVVLLNIWASWCTSCRDEMEDLMAVQELYGFRGFRLVAVNIDNAPASAVDFLQRLELRTRKKPGFIFLYDKEKTVPNDYRQRAMPTSYLIDRQGIVRKIYPGSFSKGTLDGLKTSIEEALK